MALVASVNLKIIVEHHDDFVHLRSNLKYATIRRFITNAPTPLGREMGQMTLFFAHQFSYTGGRSYLSNLYACIRLVHDLFHPLSNINM